MISLSLAATALSAPVATTTATAGWPFYRGVKADGTTAEKVGKWGKEGPKQVWKTAATAGFSSMCVADGLAFTLVKRDADGVPSETLVALNAADGKEGWAFPLKLAKYDGGGDSGTGDNGGGDGPRSTPTYSNGKVYVFGAAFNLHCVDAKTGKAVWEKDLMKEFGGKGIKWQNASSPLVEDGLVFVAGGGDGQSLIAFKADSGEVAWKTGKETATHATPIAATIDNTKQVIFFLQSGLVSVDPKTGEELWRHPFKFSVSTAASPIVYKNWVYCSAGYGVGASLAEIKKSGSKWEAKEVKRFDKLFNHWSTPVVKDGYLYGMFSFKEYGKGPLCCVEMKTGETKWSEPGFGAGNVIIAGDTILALSDKGELVQVEAKPNKYQELARADVLDGKCWSTPVLTGGRIYARSTKEVVCVEAGK